VETDAQWPWAEAERESGNAGLGANGLGEISGRQSIQGLLRGWFYYPHFMMKNSGRKRLSRKVFTNFKKFPI